MKIDTMSRNAKRKSAYSKMGAEGDDKDRRCAECSSVPRYGRQ